MLIGEASTDDRIMDWVDEPATEQQLIHLRELGFSQGEPLMRTQAARLIRELRRNPGRSTPAPVLEKPEAPPRGAMPVEQVASAPVPSNDFSEGTRTQAYRFRAVVEAAHRALVTNPNGPNVRADAAASTQNRQEFWLDTCREAKEMRIGSVPVLELYQMQGYRFFPPSPQQVQELLTALDEAMPNWDLENPELFYQTLELNFPHLVRRR